MLSGSVNNRNISKSQGWLALSPIILFLVLYVVVSLISRDFYKMPIAVAMAVASMWGVCILKGVSLQQRIEIFSKSAGHPNILYMIWIFILAGAFANLAKETGSVESTVALALNIFPPQLVVPMLFFASCFISISIGTSVGTVVALTPLAVEIARTADANVAFFTAVVLGGAFFGDNLSFISDTTIAATRSQGCDMSEKFKANLWIALPAAIITLAIYIFQGISTPEITLPSDTNPLMVLPYLIVIISAIAGINVTIVLTLGIVTSLVMGLTTGIQLIDLAGFAGNGIDSMGNLIIITLLAAGLVGIIKQAGGIDFILNRLTSKITGRRGGQTVISSLVALVNLCTANNTVAIITVGEIAHDISSKYGIDPRKSASLLDSASCVVQCLIPYGAQTLMAASLASISPIAPFPYLYYPWVLALMIALSIIFLFPKRLNKRS